MWHSYQVIMTDIVDIDHYKGAKPPPGRYRVMGITYQPQSAYGEVQIASNLSHDEASRLAVNLIEIDRVMQS